MLSSPRFARAPVAFSAAIVAVLSVATACTPEKPAAPRPPAPVTAAPAASSAASSDGEVAGGDAAATAEVVPPGSTVINGDLKPSQSAELSFKAGGQLIAKRVERGDTVRAGAVLGQLSDVEAQAQLAQAEAAVAMAKAQTAIAEDQAKRIETLRASDAAPGNAAVATKLQVEAAQAGVRQAEAATALARANVANHVLRAPFDGVVTRVPDGIGGTVGPGYPVFRLEKLDPLLMVGTIPESALVQVNPGDPVTLLTDGRTAQGTVKAVIHSLEPVSRRVPVEILVPNPDGTLVAGSYVRARIGPTPSPAPVSARREGAK